MTKEKQDKVREVLAIGCYLLLIVVFAVSAYLIGRNTTEKQALADAQGIEQRTSGMPLDAIQYPAPAWMPDARQVFEVADRKSNVKWWVIRTADQQWITLPIGEYQDAG